MLAAVTSTLKQCTSSDMATPAALALKGLRELCRAEVLTHTPPRTYTRSKCTVIDKACFAGRGHCLNVEEPRTRAEL